MEFVPVKRKLLDEDTYPVPEPAVQSKVLKINVTKRALPEDEAEPNAEPDVQPEPEPEPEPTTLPPIPEDEEVEPEFAEPEQVEADAEPESEATSEDEDSDLEVDIHPRLQEILQYLADDEHITMMRDSELQTIRNDINTLSHQMMQLIEILQQPPVVVSMDGLMHVPQEDQADSPEVLTLNIGDEGSGSGSELGSGSGSELPSEHELKPEPEPVSPDLESDYSGSGSDPSSGLEPPVQSPEQEHATIHISKSVQQRPHASLADLINQYNNEPEHPACKTFNDIFEATFVFNHCGRAEQCVKYLRSVGVQNCFVVDPVYPEGCPPNKRAIYYMVDIIQTAREEGYKTINVIADVVQIHKVFFEAFEALVPQITGTRWDILQYCCVDHVAPADANLDWEFYLNTNPDLRAAQINTEQKARQHWNECGMNQGRTGIPDLVPTKSSNTLAFAMKSTVFVELAKNLELALSQVQETPLFDFRGRHVIKMTRPNLFMAPNSNSLVPALSKPMLRS